MLKVIVVWKKFFKILCENVCLIILFCIIRIRPNSLNKSRRVSLVGKTKVKFTLISGTLQKDYEEVRGAILNHAMDSAELNKEWE